MAFGQQSGPPASARQLEELKNLLRAAGYADFRDARHPLALSQRQAGGRFTRDEAAALIERLSDPHRIGSPVTDRSARAVATQQLLAAIPAEQLAAELERRGWLIVGPRS